MTINNLSNNKIEKTTGFKGFGWLFLSYFCGTILFITSKYALTNTSPANFLYWWYGAGLVFHTLHAISKESISFETINKKYLLFFAIYILLDISGTYSFFLSLRMMDSSIVSFISQSQIIFALFLGFFFLQEVLNKQELGASVVIIAGMFVMTFNSGSAPLAGILLMLYANFTGAVNLVIVRKIGCRVGTFTFARIRTISLFITFLIYNLYMAGEVFIPPFPLLAVIIFGSFFGPFLNVISIYKSLEYIPAGKLALFRSAQPLFVMIASGIFLKTIPGLRESIGGFIIIIGSIILAYFHMSHVIGLKRPLRTIR